MSVQADVRYPGGDKTTRAPRRVKFTDSLRMTMLRNNCFRRVRAWAITNTVPHSTSLRTPQTVLELAKMLRDPNGNLRCPFGTNFEEQGYTPTRIDRSHRIPFWLALVELHSYGYRYGSHSDKHLPHVFEQVVDVLVSKRQERSQGAPEQLIGVCSDLAGALMTNSVFKHKVATHDLLSYAIRAVHDSFDSIFCELSTTIRSIIMHIYILINT